MLPNYDFNITQTSKLLDFIKKNRIMNINNDDNNKSTRK